MDVSVHMGSIYAERVFGMRRENDSRDAPDVPSIAGRNYRSANGGS